MAPKVSGPANALIPTWDRATATGPTGSDGYTAIAAADVTDEALLPKRFDAFAAEMRAAFEMLGDKILPAIHRVEAKVIDTIERVGKLERRADKADARADKADARAVRHAARTARHAARIAAIEKKLKATKRKGQRK